MFAELPCLDLFPEIEMYTDGVSEAKNVDVLEKNEHVSDKVKSSQCLTMLGHGILSTKLYTGETSQPLLPVSIPKEVTVILSENAKESNASGGEDVNTISITNCKSEDMKEIPDKGKLKESSAAEDISTPIANGSMATKSISDSSDESTDLSSEAESDNPIRYYNPIANVIEISDDEDDFFEMELRKSHVGYTRVELPIAAAELLPNSKAEVVLYTGNSGWPMTYSGNAKRRKLSNGWADFVAGNDLKLGDKVVFQRGPRKDCCVTLRTQIVRDEREV